MIILYVSIPTRDQRDAQAFLPNNLPQISEILRREFQRFGTPPPQLKIYTEMHVEIMRPDGDRQPFFIISDNQFVMFDGIDRYLNELAAALYERSERHSNQVEGSGFAFQRILSFKIILLHPHRAQAYGNFVPYPRSVRGASSIFNPSRTLGMCLIQCLAAYFRLKLKPDRNVNLKRSTDNIRFCRRYVSWEDSLECPIAWEDIKKLESLNKCSIYVYKLTRNTEGVEEEEEEEEGGSGRRVSSRSNFRHAFFRRRSVFVDIS